MEKIRCILRSCFIVHLLGSSASAVQINYRLSQPQIYVDDGHIYLVPAEHRNLVLVANGTGRILFNEVELNNLVSSVKNSTQDLDLFKKIFGSPTNTSAGLSQRISSIEHTINRLNLVESLDTRLTNVERQLVYNVSSSEESTTRRSSVNSRLRRLKNRVDTIENRMRELGDSTENPCGSRPCSNGGTCIPTMYGAFCWCRDGWEGPTCQQDVNECSNFAGTDLGCQNGATCINRPGGYDCRCGTGWMGIHCNRRTGDCSSGAPWELCGHGICINQHTGSRPFTCICDQGWKTDGSNPACTVDIDECTSGHPSCSINPPVACINTPGSYVCGPCPLGYTGNGHRCMDVNECLVNNGGCSVNPMVQCINTPGSRTCGECPPGYIGNGVMCTYRGVCQVNNGGCHPLARCVENPVIGPSFVQCICPAGYTGTGMGLNGCFPYQSQPGGGGSAIGPPIGNPCSSNPCSNSGICHINGNSFSCFCMPGYTGPTCASRTDPCQSQPCQNGGLCVRTASSSGYVCRCTEDFTGESCELQVESCGGVLTTSEGILHYPHDTSQSTYQNNVNCEWVIRAESGKVLNITFTRFHLEGDSSCSYDSLDIRDGADMSAPRIGKFCGEAFPKGGNIISTHNALYFRFNSDHSTVGLGFAFSWNTTDPICGGFISNQTHGSINSPGYPGNYPHDRDCIWSISVNLGKRIQLVFATFQIERHSNCSFDYLEVRDGLEENSQVLAKYCNTTLPPPLVSSGPFLTIRFHSDVSNTDAGFHVTFAEVPGIPGCGGVLSTPTGVISSPQHPEPYAHGLECEWLIRLPSPMDSINLKFLTFDLEGSNNCLYDYVEIRDGSLPTSPLVGRFCGRTSPPEFNSRSSQLFVKFRSDESVAFGGFAAKYEAVCGGVLTASEGMIRSPYYPNIYPKNRECVFLISQPVGKAILVDFIDFDVESGVDTRCLFDYLEIRDGDTVNSTLIGHYCGPPESAPERIVSTHNYLWLKFKTDGSVQNRGFLANYSTIDTGCGGILRDTHGVIHSPGHPEVYPHGVSCTWIIRGVPGQVVRLTWATFSLEQAFGCRFDYVEVFDNSTMFRNGSSMGRFCGTNLPPLMSSSDNTMTINFRSDHSVAHDGFMANFILLNSSTVCGGEYYTEYGVLRSPRFPQPYPNRKSCVWVIKVPTGKQIMLNVTDFEMENGTNSRCNFDYLEIRNGAYATSPLIGKYCGNVLPPRRIPSFSNALYLKFSSDTSRSLKGFQIIWDGTTTGCGGALKSPSGSIVSPNYPLSYGTRMECIWTIEVTKGSAIQLVFVDLDIQRSNGCWGEHIEIRDGKTRVSPLIGKYCHSDSVLSLNSTGEALRIKFVSGLGSTGRGFQINYRATCNRVIKGFHGVIESPNFPNPYPHNRNCTWEIQAPKGNKVNVSFSHFAVEQPRRNSCIYDFVEVMEWKRHDASKTSLGKFCGDNRPDLIASSKDTVSVSFVSDHSLALNGFRLEWRVEGCGGRIIRNWARIKSPNYPRMYSNNVECFWHITTELGTKAQLNILELDIERHEDCQFDGLKVYGGSDETSPLLTTLCHTTQGDTVITAQGNNMYIKFYSDGSVPAKGFLGYIYGARGGCGGQYRASSGFIYSPNYPNKYDHNADCGWLIQVDDNHVVQLQFLDFVVERHINCSYDHVAIYDGGSSYAPLLLIHCGDQLPDPPVIRSTGNKMFVHLKTDGSSSSTGFKANYTMGCGARLTGTNSGVITSPNFPNIIPSRTNCSWIIVGQTPDDHVTLTFTTMNMAVDGSEVGCETTFIEILDGEDEEAPSLGKYCSTRIPPSITSRGNSLMIRLVTLYHGGYGFRAVYDHSTSACGGTLTSMNGSFTSPNYPIAYPPNVDCVWEIEATVGNKVELSFRRLEIETSDFCNTDFIEIHENNAEGKLLGHFCGNEIPGNITASRRLWILFRTDSEGQAPGFWADFNLVHGNELNGSFGELASPSYPNPSVVTGIFTWRVTVNESHSIEISFDSFDFDFYSDDNSPGDCSRQTKLTIYDGYDADAPILFRQCRGSSHTPVTSTGNVVFIEYNKILWYNWFKISWNEIQSPTGLDTAGFRLNVTGCGGNFSVIEGNTTTLLSPFYPYNYPNNIRCVWGIDSPPHTRVKLQVEDLDFESHPACQYDRVEVYDGRVGQPNYFLNQTICLRSQINTTLISSGRFLQLVMQTDGDGARPGFNFTLSTTCGGYLRETRGRITTPGYPNNYVDSDCEWIVIVRPGRTIRVTFESFDIYSDAGVNCVTDELLLRNGGSAESPFLGSGRYCGSSSPAPLETSGNKLYVRFKARTHSRRGFALIYSEVSAGCGGEIYVTDSAPNVLIMSPNFPQIPSPFTECEWLISAPQGEAIQLTFQISFQFDMSPGCPNDGIEIRDGGTRLSPEIGTYCHEMPPTLKSTSNIMYVRYYTNIPEPRTGFKAEAKIATCGGTVTGWYGTISSPGFPNPYDVNLDCLWTIKGPESSYLVLTFTEIDLSLNGGNCTNDKVIITEQNITEVNNPRNWTFCTGIRSSVRSSTNQIHVRFLSDGQRESKRGFKLIYSARRENCGGTLRSPTGIIQSPRYPQAYPHYRHCSWRIIAPEGRRIRLEFLDFDLEETYISNARRICYDSVTVYQGQWRDLPPLYNQSLCGPTLPDPVETTSNKMTLYFGTDGSVAHRGFKARYTTELASICGGIVPDLNGTITSPNITTGTPNTTTNILCDWRSDGGSENGTMIVTINRLTLPPWGVSEPNCPHGFLRISPSDVMYKYSWKSFCGSLSNVKVYIPGGSIHVEYETGFVESNFELSYKVSSCGGILSGPQDNITSPSSPSGYPVNTECIWILEYSYGSQIKVKFLDLDLDDQNGCDRDYVIVRNGKYQSSPVLGKYCGTNMPPDIISMSSHLWIEFHSDENTDNNRRGFKISTERIARGCGGVVHKKYGQLRSPESETGARYPHNTECEWVLETVPGYVINLVFTGRFDIEQTVNCTNDAVELFVKNQTENDISFTWKSIGRYCGRQMPPSINTSSTSVKVLFRTNANIDGDGFSLAWYSPCGGVFTNPSGIVRSAHYDRFNHSSSLNFENFWTWMGWESNYMVQKCDYVIQGNPNDYIVVEFIPPFDVNVPSSFSSSTDEMNAECPIVNVTMWEGNSTHRSNVFCGSSVSDSMPPFVGRGSVTISYNYRAAYQNSGFRAKYSIYKCGGEITEPGRISSPGHPFTSAPHMNCTWIVRAPPNKVVRLKFETLELEFQVQCSFDFVRLFDGALVRDERLLGTFCGNLTDDFHRISSSSNTMTVQYFTDWVIQHGGFAASVDFTLGEHQDCGGKRNVTSSVPVTIQSVDSNSDGKYESFLDCQWLISGPDYQALELTFETFNLEGGGRSPGKDVSAANLQDPCPFDFVEIRDGPGPFGQLLGQFCGNSVPPAISSSMNFVWIRFVSDGSYNFPGFRATIRSRPSPCGGTFVLNATKEVQTLTSPGYPANYGNNIRCKWTVDGATFFDEVDIKFIDMDIQASPGCANDKLEIKDVSNSYTSPEGINGPILFVGNGPTDWRFRSLNLDGLNIFQDVRYCGSQNPPDFFSVGRSAELVFHTDSSGSGKGFKIEYKAAGCNRTYENSQGRIFSPEFPTHSPMFLTCQFSIRAQNGSSISLYFNKFLLPGVPREQYATAECTESAFEVRDGSANGQLLGQFCSSSRPNPVFSLSSVLWVKYFTKLTPSLGYDITYTTTSAGRGCGGEIFHTGGSFTSPLYPGNYSQDADCRWRVRVPAGLLIQIEFTTFMIGGDCATDFLEILSTDSHTPSATPVLFSRYCPGDVLSLYSGTTDTAVVRYKTSRNNTGSGWRAEFKGITSSLLPRASEVQ